MILTVKAMCNEQHRDSRYVGEFWVDNRKIQYTKRVLIKAAAPPSIRMPDGSVCYDAPFSIGAVIRSTRAGISSLVVNRNDAIPAVAVQSFSLWYTDVYKKESFVEMRCWKRPTLRKRGSTCHVSCASFLLIYFI